MILKRGLTDLKYLARTVHDKFEKAEEEFSQ